MATKKTFMPKLEEDQMKEHPAMSFISRSEDAQEEDARTQAAIRLQSAEEARLLFKERIYSEYKTARASLLFRPSVKTSLERLAILHKTSVNEIIGNLAEAYVVEHLEELEKINSVLDGE